MALYICSRHTEARPRFWLPSPWKSSEVKLSKFTCGPDRDGISVDHKEVQNLFSNLKGVARKSRKWKWLNFQQRWLILTTFTEWFNTIPTSAKRYVCTLSASHLGSFLDAIDANVASFWYAGVDYWRIARFIREASVYHRGTHRYTRWWATLKRRKKELRKAVLSLRMENFSLQSHQFLERFLLVKEARTMGPETRFSVEFLVSVYHITETRNAPLADKNLILQSAREFHELITSPAPPARLPLEFLEGVRLAQPRSDGHLSLAASATVEFPRSKGGRAAAYFAWAKSQMKLRGIKAPETVAETATHWLYSQEAAQQYYSECLDQAEAWVESGEPIPHRLAVVGELGKARVITVAPTWFVQVLITMQKILMHSLRFIPEVSAGVFSRDDAYKAYAEIPDVSSGDFHFFMSDLKDATNGPPKSGIVDTVLPWLFDQVGAESPIPQRDLEIALSLLMSERKIEVGNDYGIPREFLTRRGILMGDPMTKVILTIAYYLIVKAVCADVEREHPGCHTWFRIKGDDVVILVVGVSPEASTTEKHFLRRISEAQFRVSPLDTFVSHVAFYCEGLFLAPRGLEIEKISRARRFGHAYADPVKGRYMVPFWKVDPGGKDPLVLPLSKLESIVKRLSWFVPDSVQWRRTYSCAMTATKSFRLERDPSLFLPPKQGGIGLLPDCGVRELSSADWNQFIWSWAVDLKSTVLRDKIPEFVDPGVPRFVARSSNHAFSHHLRVDPRQVIPTEWEETFLHLEDVDERLSTRLAEYLGRNPNYSSDISVASYAESVDRFSTVHLGRPLIKRLKTQGSYLGMLEAVGKIPPPTALIEAVTKYRSNEARHRRVDLRFMRSDLIGPRLVVFKPEDPEVLDLEAIKQASTPGEARTLVQAGDPFMDPDAQILRALYLADFKSVYPIVTNDRRLCFEARRTLSSRWPGRDFIVVRSRTPLLDSRSGLEMLSRHLRTLRVEGSDSHLWWDPLRTVELFPSLSITAGEEFLRRTSDSDWSESLMDITNVQYELVKSQLAPLIQRGDQHWEEILAQYETVGVVFPESSVQALESTPGPFQLSWRPRLREPRRLKVNHLQKIWRLRP